jgi:hypothetical protein
LEGALTRIEALRADGPAPIWQLELFLGVVHTDILLVHCRPLAEVEEAGRASLELVRTPGLAGTGIPIKINIAEVMLRAGQVSRAAALLSSPEEARRGGTVQLHFLLGTLARIEVCRDRLSDARRAIAELDATVASMPRLTAWRVEAAAQVDLWSDQPSSALRRLRTALEELLATNETNYLGPVFALAARAAADCPSTDRDRDTLAVLEDLRRRATLDPFAGVCGDNHGWHASWDAELARLSGNETLDLWARAAAEWDKISRPHEAAYCRWRGGQLALGERHGTVAARLLKRAATDAHEHIPLHRAIAATTAGVR